jgi:hypothetical protein
VILFLIYRLNQLGKCKKEETDKVDTLEKSITVLKEMDKSKLSYLIEHDYFKNNQLILTHSKRYAPSSIIVSSEEFTVEYDYSEGMTHEFLYEIKDGERKLIHETSHEKTDTKESIIVFERIGKKKKYIEKQYYETDLQNKTIKGELTDYNYLGQIVKSEYWEEFDNEGKTIVSNQKSKAYLSIESAETYFYYSNDKLNEKQFFLWDEKLNDFCDKMSYKTTFEYDSKSRLVSELTQVVDNSEKVKADIYYTYDLEKSKSLIIKLSNLYSLSKTETKYLEFICDIHQKNDTKYEFICKGQDITLKIKVKDEM